MTGRRNPHKTARRTTLHAVAVLVAALYVVPIAFILLVSLTPKGVEPGTFPTSFAPGNFVAAFRSTDFLLFFLNSTIVAAVATAIQTALACSAGYALALLPIRGRSFMLLGLVALLVVPPEVVLVPLFIMVSHFPLVGGNDLLGQGGSGLLNSLPGLMVPHLLSALGIFLMRQFYVSLPAELGDAARVDGAGEAAVFARIYTPLVKPAIAVVAVFAFQGAWNDFLWPLLTTRTNDVRTVQLGLTVFYQENSTQWNLLMAAALGLSIPILILFLLIQRFFRSGVLSGALK